ncbi:hypothetical protein CAMGR0001_0200 [Campylobacter gracilis RM3268]|uniref:Uncharacterized protein n=1 Tax=Campylobacter gracilis RM3268 TaxID=553220 RepID=C8PKH8_9BACT|nr:hypothetical protein CAMGR0001_0200 [Campylobacter gracilis RM3268]
MFLKRQIRKADLAGILKFSQSLKSYPSKMRQKVLNLS